MDDRDTQREQKLQQSIGNAILEMGRATDPKSVCWELGRTVLCYSTLERTMTTAKEVAKQYERTGRSFDGGIVIADTVSGAKGRLGREWHAGAGGLWFSMTFTRGDENPDLYSIAAGMAPCAELQLHHPQCAIRWVNDVMVKDKKLCGILIETFATDKARYIQIGVGVNVNNTIPQGVDGVTLRQLTGRTTDLDELLTRLIACYAQYIGYVRHQPSNCNIPLCWTGLSNTIGRKVIYHPTPDLKNGYTVTALDITSDGALIVRRSGKIETLRTGEIRYCR